MIGSLGDVVFDVSSEAVRTFDRLQMKHGAKYAEHDIHGAKPLLEFNGLALSSVSFSVRFDAALGVDPKEELDALRELLRRHEAVPFVLDGEPQGVNLWVVTELSEAHEVLTNKGELIVVSVDVSIREYVERGS